MIETTKWCNRQCACVCAWRHPKRQPILNTFRWVLFIYICVSASVRIRIDWYFIMAFNATKTISKVDSMCHTMIDQLYVVLFLFSTHRHRSISTMGTLLSVEQSFYSQISEHIEIVATFIFPTLLFSLGYNRFRHFVITANAKCILSRQLCCNDQTGQNDF